MSGRVRWRITLDELAHMCKVPAGDVSYWAELGALGPRYSEPRDQGLGRHITREAAQRAVIMSRLIHAGVRAEEAAQISSLHNVKETGELAVTRNGVQIRIDRTDLP